MTSSPGGLQDDESSTSTRQQPPSLQIPKNRAGLTLLQLPSNGIVASDAPQRRLSGDVGSAEDISYDGLNTSPLLTPSIESGLRRIRRNPPPSLRNVSSPSSLSPLPSRKSSRDASGPASPLLPFGEDLTRFPSESLHSFSFAHHGSESLHARQNVMKRSIDFMRERLGWASTTPRIASAQAKLAGDEELLSMVELLQKASVMSPGGLSVTANALGISGGGPLTGPAHLMNENVFERSFDNHSTETSAIVEEPEEGETSIAAVAPSPSDQGPDLQKVNEELAPYSLSQTTTAEDTQDGLSPIRPQRRSLKRTYTDVGNYNLEHRLTEAMAQPYHSSQAAATISPTNAPSFRPPPPLRSGTSINDPRTPHGHKNNQAQAIFTTEAQSPWTITAANDLACLVFGVSRAEVRKLGIMEVIDESRRKWLEEKLRNPDSGSTPKHSPHASPSSAGKTPSTNTLASALGNGITAKLLSKPPSRWSAASRRSKTEGGAPPSRATPVNPHHASNKSRGVLLCGDVLPIRKMDGSTGSASLWVKEKGGGLIWVLEKIAEDVAYLVVDEIGSVIRGRGDVQSIWGLERVRNGMDVTRLIPAFPKLEGTNTGAVDYDAVARLRSFTARTSNSISIPITVDRLSGENTFRISSFPHIAGIVIVNPSTMRISGSNAVFSSALFGYANPDGMPVNDLIPGFGDVLRVMTDEDKLALEDGIVIPEHSFRRARALLAIREGRQDAAAVFLRPSGLPARHRDGAEIMVDVQMRVVMQDQSRTFTEAVIQENEVSGGRPANGLAYALWITYSRQMHAVNHGIGPVTPMVSRPGTPPQQPLPGTHGRVPGDSEMPSPMVRGTSGEEADLRTNLLSQQLDLSKSREDGTPSDAEPYEHPSPDMIAAGVKTITKKRIDDFNILEEMGQGAYGQVKLARYKKVAAKKMVIKYVTKRRILVDTWHRDRRLGTVPLEIHVLDYLRRDGLQHPNIVEMADFFEDDTNYYIEMLPHALPGMDLFDYIELRVTMDEAECRMIFRQVAEALAHLHIKAKVVHRDIKDENVVLDGDGRVKVVDFGSAAYIKSGPFDVFVGTIDYAAPEVLRGQPYRGKEQDVWALGILLYTIVYKENPFYSIDEIMDHDLRVPYVLSDDCIDLIRRMLDRDVERRISIQAVLEHPWTTTVDEVAEDGDASAPGVSSAAVVAAKV